MNSYTHQHTSLTEPMMTVSTEETVINAEEQPSPHPPCHSTKRDVSKTLMHTRSYFGKRQKKSHPEPETPVECPYPTGIAPRDYMCRSWSNIDSPHPLLPTPLPSPAVEDAGQSLECTQKPLQVGELVNKLNFKLKKLFGSRRGSAEEGDIPLTSSARGSSMTSLNLCGPLPDDPNLETNPDYLMWNGSCQLPNVSEFFDTNGEVGPSNFYHTADWSAFQKSLQAQGKSAPQARLVNHADADLDGFDFLRGGYGVPEAEFDARKRKDSLFGFDFLRSRRSSKVDKGKGRMVEDDEIAMSQQQDEATAALLRPPIKPSLGLTIPSLADIGVLPRVSMDTMMPALSRTEPDDIPQAEFSSLESDSTPSWHCGSASSTPPDAGGATATGEIAARQVMLCHIVPPTRDSAAVDDTSPASSFSSFHDVSIAVPTASKDDSSAQVNNKPTTPATPCLLPAVAPASSSSSSSQRHHHPLSSLTTMKSLSLGPSQHGGS